MWEAGRIFRENEFSGKAFGEIILLKWENFLCPGEREMNHKRAS
jgi:hypothetical protein